ncbi:efflux RND transporter periplasmic adaptor subunit [Pseudoalteromonas arctica]|uniref:Efflux RND transporter periplasmic adaptor subunit n=1 Tax=Pseudoalteromonas arctica TaxID=394751 RepID=A0A7Y0DVN6_9GAMM|nr:efflux RND transporter periplasmic adaptor subunit [Pseudoalteromonas arctica]NMM42461.1 efflux RND transporter periplasmic adaptor subunit [Pseudoalteromonas arctica]
MFSKLILDNLKSATPKSVFEVLDSPSQFREGRSTFRLVKQGLAAILILQLNGCGMETYESSNTGTKTVKEYPFIYPKKTVVEPVRKYYSRVQGIESFDKALFTPARVQKIFVREGQQVEQGEKLVQLYSPLLSQQVDVNKAELASAKADLILQEKELARLEGIFLQGLTTKQLLDAKERDLEIAKFSVVQAISKLKQAENELAETELYAPSQGVVAKLYLREGSFVAAGTPIFRFESTVAQKSTFQIPESEALNISIEQTFELVLPQTGEKHIVKVLEKGLPQASKTSLFELSVLFPEGLSNILGMTAELHIPIFSDPLFEIDYSGLRYSISGDSYVLVYRDQVEKVPVTVVGFSDSAILVRGLIDEKTHVISVASSKLGLDLREFN